MDIKVGEYVRTKFGYIAKLERIYISEYTGETVYECDSTIYMDFDNPIRCFEGKDELRLFIVKHSFDIIDLIEEGDYVNGERILDITGEYLRTNETTHNKYWLSNNIKSIVTNEQYKSIEYKVGE